MLALRHREEFDDIYDKTQPLRYLQHAIHQLQLEAKEAVVKILLDWDEHSEDGQGRHNLKWMLTDGTIYDKDGKILHAPERSKEDDGFELYTPADLTQ